MRPVSRDTPKYMLIHTSQVYIIPLKQSSVNQTKLETIFFERARVLSQHNNLLKL